jgi:hypothetical protein
MARKRNTRGILYRPVPLNYLALGIALSGFLIPIYTQSPMGLIQDAQSMLADSGASLSAAVPENPYNLAAEELAAKEQALNEREAALDTPRTSLGDIFGFASFALSVILCALVALNFYLDSHRGKRRGVAPGKYSVDLS